MKRSLSKSGVLALASWTLLAAVQSNVASAQQQDYYGFSHVLKGEARSNENTNIQPTRFEADSKGGVFLIRVPDTAGTCTADYEFNWEFMDDISTLEYGKEYRFRITGRRIGGSCEKNTNTAWLKNSNSGSRLAEKAAIKNPGRTIDIVADPKSIVAYPPGKNNSVVGKVVVATPSIQEVSYITFQFDFSSFPYASGKSKQCSFEVAYVFKKNHGASAGPVNCPTLYGLGVNIGILEYGSSDNARSTSLIVFVDQALAHIRASGCIPESEAAFLVDLKTRMQRTETSKGFAAEISAFRQKLAAIINANCRCK